jgi:glucosamine 6-phosphate synthetase-like amidotransferase/phosphosugar isomerase protein
MCGVIGLIYAKQRPDLGQIAAELLKTLEYRGYDSTGAAIQGEGTDVRLVKGVGAPRVLVHSLGITGMAGRIFCGQVRWATFGAVDERNAQPHVVRCHVYLYGAHNGNVTNCDALKTWLRGEGHAVVSDNDGEMVVHTIEHAFARELLALPEGDRHATPARRAAMRRAIAAAGARLEGSYAAVVVDPETGTVYAIKDGSSLYFGQGTDRTGNAFAIASSDLSSVLKLTRVVLPLSEGEFVEYDAAGYAIHSLRRRQVGMGRTARTYEALERVERAPVRSRLRAKDAALVPPFETFMDQEISAQAQTVQSVISLFAGGTEAQHVLWPHLEAVGPADREALQGDLEALRDETLDAAIQARFHALVDGPPMRRLLDRIPEAVRAAGIDGPPEALAERLFSSEAGFLSDLLGMARGPADLLAVRLLDVLLEHEETVEYRRAVDAFVLLALRSLEAGGRIYVVSCGSSFHAAKAACLFFNELARVELIPILPGEFRGQYARSLGDGDLVIAVSQSGETKDLIDVLSDVIATGKAIGKVALVNNVSSTLAQEKSDIVIPLRCGPEIAVPATKSFVNQMAVFYCLALELAEQRLPGLGASEAERRDVAARRDLLGRLPLLIRETVLATDAAVERAAQLLHLRPSIHLLATRLSAVAKEGALKIREVVLNHTEGFEGSEFKHGPNTILGVNTLFGPEGVDRLLVGLGQQLRALAEAAEAEGLGAGATGRLVQAATDAVFSARSAELALPPAEAALLERTFDREALLAALFADYPLVYVTGPDERDVALTVSQINTHKIRGAQTVVIAEDHPALRGAATKAPADNPHYQSVYIALPRTNDNLAVVFSATVVLQRLALKMSLRKAAYLNRLGVRDHGVHPDVPKNVSKSITVD